MNTINTGGFRPLVTTTQTSRIGWSRSDVRNHSRIGDSPFSIEPIHSRIVGLSGKSLTSEVNGSYPTGLVLRPGVDDPLPLINEANEAITADPEKAGELYQRARLALDELRYREGDLYVTAALGEARWSEDIDRGTFMALDRVREIAAHNKTLLRQESLLRATAYLRKNNETAALRILEEMTILGDTPNDVTTMMAMVAKADVCIAAGKRNSHDAREKFFRRAYDVLLNPYELPHVLQGMEQEMQTDAKTDLASIRETLAMVYVDSAMGFLESSESNYSKFTHDVLKYVFENFSDTATYAQIRADKEGPLSYFIEDGRLKDLSKLSAEELRKARLVEALHNSKFASNTDAAKVAVAGFAGGALVTYLMKSITGQMADYNEIVQGGAVGSAALLGGVKGFMGYTSPEARQAGQTGYTKHKSPWGSIKVGTGEFLKLVGAYAFFGGILPGIGLFSQYTGPDAFGKLQPYTGPDVLLTNAAGHWGQFRGAGSFLGSHIDALVTHGGSLGGYMWSYGITEGARLFWNDFSSHTVFGNSLKKGIEFWMRNFEHAFTDMPGDIYRGLMDALSFRDAGDSVIKLWKGLAGAYALTMMIRPSLREGLINKDKITASIGGREFTINLNIGKILPYVEFLCFMPMAYWLARDINIATGVKKGLDAWGIPSLGALSQLRMHFVNGGRWSNIDGAKLMTSFLVQTLYAGTGAQMVSNLSDGSAWDIYQNSMGVQLGLQLIAIPHARVTGANLWELLKIKGGQSFREESVGNWGRIFFGWATFGGTLWSVVSQLIMKPWIGSWRKEQTGTSQQRSVLKKLMRPRELNGEAVAESGRDEAHDEALKYAKRIGEIKQTARDLKSRALEEGKKWNYLNSLKKAAPEDRLRMFTALYYMHEVGSSLFPQNPGIKYFKDIVYETMTDPSTSADAVREFFKDLDAIQTDVNPLRFEFRYNLLVSAWSARRGCHTQSINRFFEERPHLHAKMRLKNGKDKSIGVPWGWKFWWFRNHLQMKDQGPRNLEGSMMQAGLSTPYWGFMTGDTVVERAPFFTLLVMSVMKKDPPYPTNVLPKMYRNLYRMLIDNNINIRVSKRELEQFMADLKEIAYETDEARRHVRHNLLVTLWAAGQVGPYKKEIDAFFDENRDHFAKWYKIDPKMDEKLKNPPSKFRGRKARRWFKNNMIGSDLKTDGTYQDRQPLRSRLKGRLTQSGI